MSLQYLMLQIFFTEIVPRKFVEAIISHVVTLVRCWSRSVRYFVNLLRFSKEKILGNIKKIWGRAEFQTKAGNLPHYHILFQSSFNPFRSYNEMDEMYEKCVRIHTHSCEKSGYRCLQRKDLDGKKVC